MNLLPQDPKKRQLALLGALSVTVLAALVVFYLLYFSSGGDGGTAPASSSGTSVNENAVKKIERDIAALQTELAHEFYAKLRPFNPVPDTARFGKQNPFKE